MKKSLLQKYCDNGMNYKDTNLTYFDLMLQRYLQR